MREILYRGKRIDGKGWVYGDLMTKYIHHKGLTIVEAGCIYYEVDPSTVGQDTGLTDKNGKRIFEGDIVEMHQFLFDGKEYEHETKGAIKWGEYGWLLSQIEGETVNKYMGYKNGEGETYFINFYGLHEESFEVIGTIHDEVEP